MICPVDCNENHFHRFTQHCIDRREQAIWRATVRTIQDFQQGRGTVVPLTFAAVKERAMGYLIEENDESR